MCSRSESNQNRILAAALLIFLLTTVFLSEFYVASHLRHRCAGEGCPVCARLESCLQTAGLARLAVPGGERFSVGLLLRAPAAILPGRAALFSPPSLLSLKIRLNN